MNDEIRNWIEGTVERADIIFQNSEDFGMMRGMWFCSKVGWDKIKVEKLKKYLMECKASSAINNEIDLAMERWKT